MKAFKLLISIHLTLSLGCSTIMKEEYEELYIETQPAGAIVSFENGMSCHTPCSLELERGENYQLSINKPGYQSVRKSISGSSWDGWLWGNLAFLFAMPIGIGVDFYTGYAYDFSPEKIQVELKK